MENLPTPHQADEGADTLSAVLATTLVPGRTLIEFDIAPDGTTVVEKVTVP
jgi:hypothetical protein